MSIMDETNNKENSLIPAIFSHNMKQIEELIKDETATGKCDANGMTALMHAAARGYNNIIPILLPVEGKMTTTKAGKYKMNGKMYEFKEGTTALMFAVHTHHPETLRLLVECEHGLSDKDGKTALMTALQSGNTEAARMLVEYEAGKQQKNGWSALMEATLRNQINIAKMLEEREHGFKINKRVASSNDYTTVFPINATAFYIAEQQKHKEISDSLKKYPDEIPVLNAQDDEQNDNESFDTSLTSDSKDQDSE